MTAPLNTASLVSSWREAMEGVTPGPWYSESVETEGSYGSGEDTTEGFDSYVVRTEAQKSYGEDAVICDALNSGTAEVHEEFDEDGTHAWDEPGRRNMEWIARCSPSGISALLDALSEATRQRDEALAALKASEEREAPLRTALEPFAREAAEWGAKVPDNAVIRIDGPCCDHPEDALFTVGDLRCARSALENSPAALADATNKDPGTEQREAGL